VFHKSTWSDGTFSRSDFVFDAERNHSTPRRASARAVPATYATPRSGITTWLMFGLLQWDAWP
jgi:hypothetical protein